MGEWTWLFTRFPLADIELMSSPIDPRDANVVVRTMRQVERVDGEDCYEVRVAPHNVAPFRGGPWLRRFRESDLTEPGIAVRDFRAFIAEEIQRERLRRG